jgi:hypothetical protein
MRGVSQNYLEAVKYYSRKWTSKIDIIWTDPTIDPSIEASANDENRISYPDQAADLIVSTSRKWAHLDGVIVPDGTYYPMPAESEKIGNQVGWYGATACNGSAVWAEPYPTLSIRFDARAINTILVCGDTAYNEYPVDFDVKIYGPAVTTTTGEGDSDILLYTKVVTGNDLLKYHYDISAEAITSAIRMDLIVKKWSSPNRIVKIVEFYSSVSASYTGDEIVSMNLTEEREIKDGTLPIGNISANELDISLQNILIDGVADPFFPGNSDSPLHEFIKKNRKIMPWLGLYLPDESIEWVPLGTFWSGDWSISEKSGVAATSCRDRMELLRKAEYDGSTVQTDVTLYDLIDGVLEYAKEHIPMPELNWSIDEELMDYTIPVAFFPKQSYFETIRQVVEACRGQAYMSRDDVLIITGFGAIAVPENPYSITEHDYFNREQPAKSEELINRIEIKTSQYIKSAATEEVYRADEPISLGAGETKTVETKYSNDPVSGAIASFDPPAPHSSIIAEEYFSWGARITVLNDGTPEAFTIVIDGYIYPESGGQIIVAEDTDSIQSNGLQKYNYPDNHLLQGEAMAQAIADGLLDSFKIPMKDVSLDWRGDPALELADVMVTPEYEESTANFYIYKNKIDFDGTVRAMTEGRKIS